MSKPQEEFINAATAVVFFLIMTGVVVIILTFARWVWGLV